MYASFLLIGAPFLELTNISGVFNMSKKFSCDTGLPMTTEQMAIICKKGAPSLFELVDTADPNYEPLLPAKIFLSAKTFIIKKSIAPIKDDSSSDSSSSSSESENEDTNLDSEHGEQLEDEKFSHDYQDDNQDDEDTYEGSHYDMDSNSVYDDTEDLFQGNFS